MNFNIDCGVCIKVMEHLTLNMLLLLSKISDK